MSFDNLEYSIEYLDCNDSFEKACQNWGSGCPVDGVYGY